MKSSPETPSEKPNQAGKLFEQLLRASVASRSQKIERRESASPAPLSFAQQRLWFLDQIEPGNCAYNVVRAYRLTGDLDVDILQKCLNEICRRHDSLRTIFPSPDGKPIQVVLDATPWKDTIPFEVVDGSSWPRDKHDDRAHKVVLENARRPFDLSQDIPTRVWLIKLSPHDHILLLVIHHIVFDGWSLGVFFRELAALYEAYRLKQSSPLKALSIQYADFAEWHRKWLQEEVFQKQLSYWKDQLVGHPEVLDIPTDFQRPKFQSYEGARHSFLISQDMTQRLKAFCAEQGVTLFMALLTAFNTLLYRYTGQDDIIVGSPIANRNRPELSDLIGFFVNALPLRTDLSGDPTFLELLDRVRDVAMGAFANQDVPFDKLVEELHVSRNLSYSPLVQTMLVLQNMPAPTSTIGDLTLTPMDFHNKTSKYDLTVFIIPVAEGLKATVEYNTELFRSESARRILTHLKITLQNLLNNPTQPISQVPLLTDEEKQQVLTEWNDTKVDFGEKYKIHTRFELQVKRTPKATAVFFEDEHLTYGALNERANQVAHYLKKNGTGPNVLVGVCMDRSLEMAVALLGVLKAGGAYVPLDPEYPEQHLNYMLNDARPPVLLTQERILGRFRQYEGIRIPLDTDWDSFAHEPQADPEDVVTDDDIAYVIYTSGSTGNPKGVMISHGGIGNHVLWMQSAFPLNESDCVLQKSPFSFDASVWEFFVPLLSGATLVMARPGGHRDSRYLSDLMQQRKVTALLVVPSLLRMLLEEEQIKACSHLRHVFCGGEILSHELHHRFLSCMKAKLYNLYGPTEASIVATSWTCRRQDDNRTIPIGRPIANTQTYILDKALQPVPPGVIGELFIGGTGLASGYLNQSALTAQKFLADPFSQEKGARLFKTGDLVRHLNDGNIEFVGRIDNQIKIRGFRVELEEIEHHLQKHPGVRQAIAILKDENSGDSNLYAYVVSANKSPIGQSDLRRFLKERLPNHMVPRFFINRHSLPMLPNGKVDRKALPRPSAEIVEGENDATQPRTPIEKTLVKLWSDILELDTVGIHDNFFDLGGHSLLATRLVAWIKKKLNAELSVRHIFEMPTISEIAASLAKKQNMTAATEADQAEQSRLDKDWEEGEI